MEQNLNKITFPSKISNNLWNYLLDFCHLQELFIVCTINRKFSEIIKLNKKLEQVIKFRNEFKKNKINNFKKFISSNKTKELTSILNTSLEMKKISSQEEAILKKLVLSLFKEKAIDFSYLARISDNMLYFIDNFDNLPFLKEIDFSNNF